MNRLPRYLALIASMFLALFAFAGSARADTAAAQALFDDAKKLMTAGKYAEACPKLEESQRLAPGIGTQYNLATCYEKLGKTATAWSLYLDVAGSAKAAGQAEREKVARQQAAALEGSISRLKITVEKPVAGIEVRRNGATVSQAVWGTAVPIDPGTHTISAGAPGKKAWETTITVEKKASSPTVIVPELEDGSPGAQAWSGGGATPPPVPAKPKTKRRSGGMIAGGIVMMVVGLGTTAAGAGILKECAPGSGTCAGEAAVLVGGLALLGGGIALTVVGAKKVPAEPPKASAVPRVHVGPTSAALSWQF